MRFIVDRIEGNFAVCEDVSKQMKDIPLADLPKDIREGNIIEYNNGIYIVNTEAEAERRAKLKDLKNSIFNE